MASVLVRHASAGERHDWDGDDRWVCCTHGDVVGDLLGRGLETGGAVELRAGEVVREIP
jgi:hypothetical protein